MVVEHQPFFYAKIPDLNDIELKLKNIKADIDGKEGKIIHFEQVEKELLGKKGIFYKVFVNFPKAVPPLSKELEKFGIDPEDETLELHLEEFFKRGEQTGVRQAALKDLGRVAEIIIDQFPHVKAVTGFSWFFDHPLTKELGFQIVDVEDDSTGYGGSTWMQFIDRHGQINQKRVNQFLATGEFPMKAKLGFIPVVDFLKRYLPAERRGSVTLQETRHGRQEIEKQFRDFSLDIKERWDSLFAEDLSAVFGENKIANDLLEKFGLKEQFFNILLEAKRSGKTLEDVKKLKGAQEFNSKLQKAIKIDPDRTRVVEI